MILVIGCIHLYLDWLQYDATLNSAPFSLWILTNGICFGILSLICLIVGLALKGREIERKDK